MGDQLLLFFIEKEEIFYSIITKNLTIKSNFFNPQGHPDL